MNPVEPNALALKDSASGRRSAPSPIAQALRELTRSDHPGELANSTSSIDAEIELLLQRASVLGGPVLVAGHGCRRHILALARDGHDVTGTESSPDLLDLKRRRSEGKITIQSDLDDLSVYIPFSLCFTNNWHLAETDSSMSRFLRDLASLLDAHGRIILSQARGTRFSPTCLRFNGVLNEAGCRLVRTYRMPEADGSWIELRTRT